VIPRKAKADSGEDVASRPQLGWLAGAVVIAVGPKHQSQEQRIVGLQNCPVFGAGRIGGERHQRVRRSGGVGHRVPADQLPSARDFPVVVAVQREERHLRARTRPGHLVECPVVVDIERHAII
jgi:hypothetical protein